MLRNRNREGFDATQFGARALRVGLLFALVAIARPCAAQGNFEKLARHIPSTANALVLLNVEKVLASPRAAQEGWRDNLQKANESGLMTVPPNAARMITAAQIDFANMKPLWEIAAVDSTVDVSMDAIVRGRAGKNDTVDKLPAAVLPSNTYVVQFGPRTVGAMFPANRQNVARWVRDSKAKASASLSPYLTKAIGYADRQSAIVLTIDLTDVFPAEYLAAKIKESELYSKRSDLKVEELAQLISTIEGVTLGVVVDQQITGSLKAEFATDAGAMKGFAKLLFMEVLGKNGLMVDDFQDWEPKVMGREVRITGKLYADGLRQVLSILQPPTTSAPPQLADSDNASETDKALYATQHYFKAVSGTLDSLRNKKNVKTLAQYGTWFDKYARHIDRLPMLNVDSDMLNYGAFVSEQLRDAAVSVRGIAQNTRTRQVNRGDSSASGRIGGYGNMFATWVDPRYESQRERSRISAEERVDGAKSARAILQDIENQTSDIRRAMTQKYKAEF